MTADLLIQDSTTRANLSGIEKKHYLFKKKIIRRLYLEGPKSNPEICKSTDLSSPSVTVLLKELIKQGIVLEVGTGTSSGGRRPNIYGLNGNHCFVAGVDINHHQTHVALFNIKNQLVGPVRTLQLQMHDANLLEQVENTLHEMLSDYQLTYDSVIALGVDLPGLVDAESGQNHSHFNNHDTGLSKHWEEHFQKPVFMENDARVMALGEYRFGLAKGRQNVLCLKLSWGVGLGMILDGKIYRGKKGFAGEFGHIQLVPEGILCGCGKRGCLETVCSANALITLARDGVAAGSVTILSDLSPEELKNIEAKTIINAAKSGDEFSIHIISKIGKELGRGLASLIHLMNPETIIIGGMMAEAEQYITAPIQHAINKYCIPSISSETQILVSNLRDHSSVMGAAALVWENLMSDNKN